MNEIPPFDSLLPPAMAARAEELGLKKASLPVLKMFILAILAGAFVSLGAVFATSIISGTFAIKDPSGALISVVSLPFGLSRLLAGLAFSIGLILVIVGGAELFTGNTLIVIAYMGRKITLWALLRNWIIVYFGNFVGSILTAILVFISRQYTFGNGAVGLNALNIGEAKTALAFLPAVALGMLCNALVCMAVWLCYSARTTTDKILAILPPIAAFVASGFEHSIANMYYIPIAMFIKTWGEPSFFATTGLTSASFPNLTWSNFIFANLLPVTLGNIIGGTLMVGVIYWFVYLRQSKK